MITYWTDERIEELKTLHATGMTFVKIAHVLGGISRNAVIGKAVRLGLPARAVAHWSYALKTERKRPEPKPPAPEPDPMPELIPTAPVRLIDATPRMCRWPLWGFDEHPREFFVCGAQTVEDTSWCEIHKRRVFSMTGPRKELAA